MRKMSLILLSIGAMWAVWLCWQGLASAQDPLSPPEGFGKKVAGTYLMWAEWDPVTEPVFPIILTINVEGTMVSTSSAALGRGDPEFFLLRQNIHTTWERSGWRELTTRHLLFMHNADGTLAFIVRTTGVWSFDEDFEEFSVQFEASLFAPTQLMGGDLRDPNPNSEEPPALGPFPSFESSGKRLHVQ